MYFITQSTVSNICYHKILLLGSCDLQTILQFYRKDVVRFHDTNFITFHQSPCSLRPSSCVRCPDILEVSLLWTQNFTFLILRKWKFKKIPKSHITGFKKMCKKPVKTFFFKSIVGGTHLTILHKICTQKNLNFYICYPRN